MRLTEAEQTGCPGNSPPSPFSHQLRWRDQAGWRELADTPLLLLWVGAEVAKAERGRVSSTS